MFGLDVGLIHLRGELQLTLFCFVLDRIGEFYDRKVLGDRGERGGKQRLDAAQHDQPARVGTLQSHRLHDHRLRALHARQMPLPLLRPAPSTSR